MIFNAPKTSHMRTSRVSAAAIGQMCEQPALPQDFFLLSSSVALRVWCRGGLETQDKWRPALNQDARRGGGEIRWEKRRFVYPWWSVDVGGLCSRHIQISLFKILWYVALGTGLEHVWECATGQRLISFTDLDGGEGVGGLCIFHTSSSVLLAESEVHGGGWRWKRGGGGSVNSALITAQLR